MANLTIKNLRKSYGNTEILKGINLEINNNEFVVFVGPSGCGKSTLLRSIAGLEEVTSGSIYLDNREITELAPAKRDLAMVFQSYALYPHMTVRKNMSFALELAKESKDAINAKVTEAARILELEPLLERKPKELSGGQRQRVAIGRSIVRQPKVFLFDEPLSNLDAALRVQMRLELARLHHDLEATMVYVTHDQVEAMTLADKVVVMNQGQIEQVGSPVDLYHFPESRFVAGFLGMPKMSFLRGTIKALEPSGVTVALDSGAQLRVPVSGGTLSEGESVELGVRPEHIQVTEPNESPLNGQLDIAENLGSDTFCYVRTSIGETITVRMPGRYECEHGATLGLSLDLSECHLFDEQGRAIRKLSRIAA